MTPEENHRPESFAWLAKRSNVVRLALIFFLILSAASFFLIYGHYRDAREQVFREDRKSAKLISLIVEAYLNEIRSTLESYASRPLLLEAVRRRDVLAAKQHLASLNRVSPGMDSLLIADKLGTVWISLPDRPDVLGKNFAWRDWHRGVIREKKPYVGDAVLRVTGEKDAAIHIAVPIFDKKKEIIGILLNATRAVEIGRVLRRAPLEEGLSISVTDRNGTLLYSSRSAYAKTPGRYPFFDVVKKNDGRGTFHRCLSRSGRTGKYAPYFARHPSRRRAACFHRTRPAIPLVAGMAPPDSDDRHFHPAFLMCDHARIVYPQTHHRPVRT